jgi:hypothetical protein
MAEVVSSQGEGRRVFKDEPIHIRFRCNSSDPLVPLIRGSKTTDLAGWLVWS